MATGMRIWGVFIVRTLFLDLIGFICVPGKIA